MGRLTALITAALVLGGWFAATAPGQLGEAARIPGAMLTDELPLAGEPTASVAADDGEIGDALGSEPTIAGGPEGPHVGAEILRRTGLRDAPDGDMVTGIGPRTRFSGPQILAVVARRGRWVGVLHPWMPNGKAGWVDAEDVKLVTEPWAIEVDRSARTARVRHEGRVVDRFPVSVGRAGSPTPVGRFAVTDRLSPTAGSPYGCCILALSGTQPNLPTGWNGGDRLALHGSPDDGTGAATSSGCIRVREADLRKLMKRIPVGTRVTITP